MKPTIQKWNGSAGFTLIELVIVMTIMSIVTLAVAVPMIEYPRLYATVEADQAMAREARNVWQWLGRDLRGANSVLAQAGPYQTQPSGTLVLANSGAGNAKLVVWKTENGALTRLEFADLEAKQAVGRMTLAQPKTSLALTFDAPPPNSSRVTVALESRRPILNQDRTYSLEGEFHLRRAMR